MWKTVQDILGKVKQKPPRVILHENKLTTSLLKICNVANNFFISQIMKIREKFTQYNDITPIQILEFLLPSNVNSLKISLVAEETVKKLLKKAKGTNC